MKRQIFVSLVVLGMVVGTRVYAADLYVPGTYSTIQAAVNAANDGDTIYVFPGTYTEFISINKRVYVMGIHQPVIDPPPLEGGAITLYPNADGSSISGFKIIGATGNQSPFGSGIICYTNSTITDNIIYGNAMGIYCEYSSSTIIKNNIISNNTWDGIICQYNPFLNIINNTISRNAWGRGISCYSSFLNITNNTIFGNKEMGIVLGDDFSFATITNNII